MPKFRKATADQVMAKRGQHTKSAANGTAMVKGFTAPPSWNKESRSARFVMTSESEDRYADIIVQSGIDTDNFMRNPQGLLFHNSRSWPIGQWSDVKKILSGRPKRTEGVLNFLPEGTDDDADRAARHVSVGSIRTVSIGFIPDWEEIDFILDDDDDWTGGFRFNKCELIECSVVPIPANPDALVKDAGEDMTLARNLVEHVLDTYAKTPEGLLVPMDLYRQKHMDLVGNRKSYVVDKAFSVETKEFTPASAMKLAATTDDEAKAFIGAKVTPDPANSENKDWPWDVLAKAEGEVVNSYIVNHGENKGVHGLWVEFLTDDYSGMFRGIKAERFLLTSKQDESEEKDIEEPTDTAPEPEMKDVEENVDADEKDADEDLTVPKSVEIGVDVDISGLKAAEEAVDRTSAKVDTLIAKIVRIFGGGTEKIVERIEPEMEPKKEIPPPTEEEKAAAREKAAAVRQRFVEKGLIAAE